MLAGLLTQTQTLNKLLVALRILVFEICQVAAALPNQLKKTPTRSFIVFMKLEMFDELVDAVGKKSYLHFGRTGILRMQMVLLNDGLLLGST